MRKTFRGLVIAALSVIASDHSITAQAETYRAEFYGGFSHTRIDTGLPAKMWKR